MRSKDLCCKVTVFFFAVTTGLLTSCGNNSSKDFEKAMSDGDLQKAQEAVVDMSSQSKYDCALQLIKAWLSIDEADKAMNVYDNITKNHYSRSQMSWHHHGQDYEEQACKLLREYLVAHGDYERAWNYYPLDLESESCPCNAQDHYAYISDVVSALCKKGNKEEARKFVEDQLQWFVTYVDPASDENWSDEKANFNSTEVRQRLYEQIDNGNGSIIQQTDDEEDE